VQKFFQEPFSKKKEKKEKNIKILSPLEQYLALLGSWRQ
jgi:hypothetical protein